MFKKFGLVIGLVLCRTVLLAQLHVPAWASGADQSDFSFGFNFNYVTQDYKIIKKPDWRKPYADPTTGKNITDSLTNISSPKKQGFAVGFIARYSITDHFEVRSTPSFVFCDRELDYDYRTPSENTTKTLSNASFDVPLLLKIKSDRIGNFRAYLVGGAKYSFAIGKGQTDATDSPLQRSVKNMRNFASYETGIGCDIYFEYFKMSPEIKLANSFGNVLTAEDHPYAEPISKLFLHSVMFTLHFE